MAGALTGTSATVPAVVPGSTTAAAAAAPVPTPTISPPVAPTAQPVGTTPAVTPATTTPTTATAGDEQAQVAALQLAISTLTQLIGLVSAQAGAALTAPQSTTVLGGGSGVVVSDSSVSVVGGGGGMGVIGLPPVVVGGGPADSSQPTSSSVIGGGGLVPSAQLAAQASAFGVYALGASSSTIGGGSIGLSVMPPPTVVAVSQPLSGTAVDQPATAAPAATVPAAATAPAPAGAQPAAPALPAEPAAGAVGGGASPVAGGGPPSPQTAGSVAYAAPTAAAATIDMQRVTGAPLPGGLIDYVMRSATTAAADSRSQGAWSVLTDANGAQMQAHVHGAYASNQDRIVEAIQRGWVQVHLHPDGTLHVHDVV